MATYVNNLRLKEIATGDESGTWGDSTNTNLELIGQALGYGTEAITTNADTHATTIADGAADEGRALMLKYTGTLDSTCTITLGPNTVKKVWIIENATSGSQSIIIKQGSGATVTIGDGRTAIVYSDGAGSGAAVVDALTDLTITDTLTVAGTTITIGDATAEDTKLVFDGAAQDYYMGLDDSADDLVIGLGSAVGTTPAIEIDENQDIKFAQSIGVGQAASSTTGDIVAQTMALKGTTPTLTIGDAGAEDTKIVFDGNAKDFHIGLDDSADTLVIGDGSTLGTNPILTLTDDSVTIGDGAAVDTKIVYDGNAKDFYIGLDDSADKLVIGEGSTVGTNNILTITDDTVTLGDAAAVDTALIFDGNAQDFHIALDDSADDLVVGVGSTVGSNTAFAVDENSKTTFSGASQFNSTVTVGVDDTGYDVKLFGATASKYMLWDESADSLIVKDIVDAVNYKVNGGQGSDGQVLTSTGSGVAWEDAGGGVTGLTGLVENNSIWLGNDPSSTTSTAEYSVGLGATALDAITTGDDNTAVGYDALTAVNTGDNNTALGYEAGKALTIGTNNVFIGHGAGKTIDKESGDQGSMNTFVGQDAGALITNSQRCTYVGRAAGGQMSQGPTHQTGLGMYALSANYGTRNTALGYGCLQTGSGSDMVAVGSTLTSTGSASIMLGYNITDNTSDEVIIGDSASYYTLAYSGSGASWAHSSDERMKKDITTDTLGLSFINDIRPVTFKLKAPSEFPTEWNSYSPPTHTNALGDVVEQRTTPRNTDLQHGLIAQEVKAALDTAGVSTFSGWSEREDGQQRIAKGMFILPLINAVKELTTRLEAAEAKITALEG